MSEDSEKMKNLMDQIGSCALQIDGRRGKHAAALWSVSDFLSSLPGCLVPFRDEKNLEGHAWHLCVTKSERIVSRNQGWGLFLTMDSEQTPAYRAPAELQVAAVRRLPEFLANYVKLLESAAGSKHSINIADMLVQATTGELKLSMEKSAAT